MAKQDCGCKVVLTGPEIHLAETRIIFCPMHGAAGDMLAALERRSRERHMLTSAHQVRKLEDGGAMAGRLPWEKCEDEPCPSDRTLIAAARGGET